jgi:predicted permease
MIKSYLKTSWRSLYKDKFSTLLNLIGLSTGLTCSLLIYLWIMDELSVDKFHEKDNQLYQVMKNQVNNDVIKTVEWTPAPLAESLLKEMPEVQEAVTVMPSTFFPESILSIAANAKIKAKPQFAGNTFFNLFSYKLISGDKTQVLADKNSIVISKELANRLFNTSENIIGKTIDWELLEWKGQGIVSGIFETVPSNSTQQFDFVLPFEVFLNLVPRFKNSWSASAPSTYLTLKKGTEISAFTYKISGFVKTKNKGSNVNLFVRKYSDQYLHGTYQNGVQSGGRISYVHLFAVIALFILVIACINFMNLSTAKASKRLKEIGIRKAVGASRKTLILQYLGESVLLSFSSLIIAILLALLLIPVFNQITGKDISIPFSLNFITTCLGIALVTGLVAGSYPALYLSAFKPLTILRGKMKSSSGVQWARKGLVVFQFAVSVIMIVSVLVVHKQMQFVQSKNPGYDKDNIIYFPSEGKISGNIQTFISGIRNIPGITNASSTTHSLKGTYMATNNFNWPGKKAGDEISFEDMQVNYDMIETLGMQLIKGRSFSKTFGNEADKIILNEAAIEAMGIKDPLGKMVELGDDKKEIIGIVKDFHFESLHQSIKPLFFTLKDKDAMIIAARIKSGNEQAAITGLQKFYTDFNPGYSFDYKFLDAQYQTLYASEQTISLLSRYFAGLAILISCLGLFGLTAFTAQKRQKEIGIRKVIGASTGSITLMLSKDFFKLIALACLLAFPVALWVMNEWLQNFAYRISITPWMFLIAGLSVMLITAITIGFQSIKAAIVNPVKSLRIE